MKKNTLVCLSMTTWEGDYMKSVVHMMGNLALTHNVLFVDYPHTLKDALMGMFRRPGFNMKRLLGLSPRLRRVRYKENKVWHLTLPPVLPLNWIRHTGLHDGLSGLQGSLIAFYLRRVLRRLGWHSPIVVNAFNPVLGYSLHGKLNEQRRVYYCYDDISAGSWTRDHGARVEEKVIKSSESIIVTSSNLYRMKSRLNPNTYLVKNGVDFDLFNQATCRTTFSEKPIVGYVGSVDFRLDYALIRKVVERAPGHEFHFVGRICAENEVKRLDSLPNIHFHGPRSPEKLPDFIASCQVMWIPFAKNTFNRSVYPLKINEYLAVGKPVISTSFGDLDDFEALIHITDGAAEIVLLVQKLPRQSRTIIQRRIDHARQNDWVYRAQGFENAINSEKDAA